MSEREEKTVTASEPSPQAFSLERLKQSLETTKARSHQTIATFLGKRFARDPSSPQSAPPAATAPMAGSLIHAEGPYELGHIVATGGMGAILTAHDRNVHRSVALKVILEGADASDEHIHRLITEARITGQLEHPNIVPLHELGVTADGVVYYTMRLVSGQTLGSVLDGIREKNAATIAKFPLRTLLTIFQKVADAVAYAHSRGVVHRDLKPDNLMIGDFGEVLVMDWGLAKLLRDDLKDVDTSFFRASDVEPLGRDTFKTLSGQVKGTPRYMAPEQAEGRTADIDERTDIYALGAILYTILTLHPPISGESMDEVLKKVVSGSITPPTSYNPRQTRISRLVQPPLELPPITPPILAHCPDRRIPPALSAVAMKALARRPERRYPTVADLQRDIAAYQNGFATTAEQAGIFRLVLLLLKRHKTETALVAVALVMMIALAAAFTAKVTATLAELKETAPSFFAESRSLVEEIKFAKALSKVDYAISLQPEEARFHALRGNILQSFLRLDEARSAYARAMKLDPDFPNAEINFRLCDHLLAENRQQSSLKIESLLQLRMAMVRQGRQAEALALATLLTRGGQQLVDSWRAVLAKAGIKGTVARDIRNQLQLEIVQPDFVDLSPIRGMPLSRLKASDTQVDDLAPLKALPIHTLQLANTPVTDLAALRSLPLAYLDLSRSRVVSLAPLRGLAITNLNLAHTKISTVASLRGMPLRELQLEGCTGVVDLALLVDCAKLEFLTLPVGARNLEPLRSLSQLKRIGHSLPNGDWQQVPAVAEFWKSYDERLRAAQP